jgi:hypothetical protein
MGSCLLRTAIDNTTLCSALVGPSAQRPSSIVYGVTLGRQRLQSAVKRHALKERLRQPHPPQKAEVADAAPSSLLSPTKRVMLRWGASPTWLRLLNAINTPNLAYKGK